MHAGHPAESDVEALVPEQPFRIQAERMKAGGRVATADSCVLISALKCTGKEDRDINQLSKSFHALNFWLKIYTGIQILKIKKCISSRFVGFFYCFANFRLS